VTTVIKCHHRRPIFNWNAKKRVWRPGFVWTHWESLQRSPRLPSWI